MKDDERTPPMDQLRDRVREGPRGPEDMELLEADELVASLRDGAVPLDDADERTLGAAIGAHGRDHVLEAVTEGARVRASATADHRHTRHDEGRVLGGAERFRRTLAIGAALAAALLAVVVLNIDGDDAIAVDWTTVASLEVDDAGPEWTDSPALVADSADPAWGIGMRGGAAPADPELRRATAIVLVGDAYGTAAVVRGDGWLVTSSDLVDAAVREAAWRGETATVQVELVDVDPTGRPTPLGSARSAEVAVHDPVRGVSLLRVDGLDAPLTGALPLGDPARAGEELAVVTAPEMSGDVVVLGTAGDATNDGRRTLDGAAYVVGRVGAPVVRRSEADGASLVGVVLGGTDDAVRFADRDAIESVLTAREGGPSPYPPHPYATDRGATEQGTSERTTTWDADGALDPPARVRQWRTADESTTTVILAGDGSAARDPFGDDDWRVFVLLGPDGRRAIGVRSDGEPTRVWTSEGESSTREWIHAGGSRWTVRRTPEAEISGDEASLELLRAILGAL